MGRIENSSGDAALHPRLLCVDLSWARQAALLGRKEGRTGGTMPPLPQASQRTGKCSARSVGTRGGASSEFLFQTVVRRGASSEKGEERTNRFKFRAAYFL